MSKHAKRSKAPRSRAVAARASTPSGQTAPEIKLQINLSNGARLGPGKIELLECIDRAGSLSQGAAQMGISYRRAWLFMTQINNSFDQPAIATPPGGQGGGASKLTDFGHQLIAKYRQMELEAENAARSGITWIGRHSR